MHTIIHCTSFLGSGSCCGEDTSFTFEDPGRWLSEAKEEPRVKSEGHN